MLYRFKNITIDSQNFKLEVNGVETQIEPQVFNLILYLIENKDRVVSRDELLNHVWKGRIVSDTSINNSIKSARKAVGDDGSKQQVIKTIHSRGYQFVAELQSPVEEIKTKNSGLHSAKSHSLQFNAGNQKQQQKTKIVTGLVLVFVAIVVAIVLFWPQEGVETEKNNSIVPSIAVLPFLNNNPDNETNYYGFAIADQVIGALNYLKNITVRPSSAIRRFVSSELNPMQVGRELKVDYILSGYYTINNDDIRLNTELVDIKSNEIVWRGKSIETSYKNTFRLQDMVTRQVLEGLKIEFSTTRLDKIKQDIPQSPLAYEYYLRSIAYPYNTKGHLLAIAMLKQSLALDDQYAPTYIQLGNRTRRLAQFGLVESETLPETEPYYLKALSLNPELLDAMAHLSMLYTETNRIDEAMSMAQSMYKLNPNNANTHFTLGYIYRYAGFLDKAIMEMEKAVALDPKNIKFRSLIGTYSATGQYQKALDMTERYEPSPFTYGWQALMNNRLGDSDKALQIYDQLIHDYPNSLWANVAIIHKSAMLGELKTGLEAVDSLVNTQVKDGETIYYTAAYYGLLGDRKSCLKLLKKAVDNGYFNHLNIASNDYFTSVKADPEFQKILTEAKSKHQAFKKQFFPNM